MNERADIARRLYDWSEQRLAREAIAGFERLAALPSSRGRAFVTVYRQLSDADKATLCSGLLRRAHAESAELNVPRDTAEDQLLRQFDIDCITQASFLRALNARSGVGKSRVKGLRQAMRKALDEVAGAVDPEWDSGEGWVHVLRTPAALIQTHCDPGGKYQFRYGHRILTPNGQADLMSGQFTYYGLIGCGNVPIDSVTSANQVEDTARRVAELSHEAITAILNAINAEWQKH